MSEMDSDNRVQAKWQKLALSVLGQPWSAVEAWTALTEDVCCLRSKGEVQFHTSPCVLQSAYHSSNHSYMVSAFPNDR